MPVTIQRTLSGTYNLRVNDGEFILTKGDLEVIADQAVADGIVELAEHSHKDRDHAKSAVGDTAESELHWRAEAMREFPGYAWTGRETEWVASYVDMKWKEADQKRRDKRTDELTEALRKSRRFFARGNDDYRAALYVETFIALFVSNLASGGSLITWKHWLFLPFATVAFLWLFNMAHTHFEGSLRSHEHER